MLTGQIDEKRSVSPLFAGIGPGSGARKAFEIATDGKIGVAEKSDPHQQTCGPRSDFCTSDCGPFRISSWFASTGGLLPEIACECGDSCPACGRSVRGRGVFRSIEVLDRRSDDGPAQGECESSGV
jgi:hypothetical protein